MYDNPVPILTCVEAFFGVVQDVVHGGRIKGKIIIILGHFRLSYNKRQQVSQSEL